MTATTRSPGTNGEAARLPATKTARHALIATILASRPVHSQTELAARLAEAAGLVPQGMLSRGLPGLRAVKNRISTGAVA